MPQKIENFAEETFTFKRALWKVAFRWFMLILLLILNVSLVASTVSQYGSERQPELAMVICTYLLVGFFDLTIFLPLLFEVDSVWILPDKLVLRTLLWQAKVPFDKIVSVRSPMWLKFLIVQTDHVIYLVHRKDLQPFDMLVEKITDKVGQEKFLR